jgi:hypothetical protein
VEDVHGLAVQVNVIVSELTMGSAAFGERLLRVLRS